MAPPKRPCKFFAAGKCRDGRSCRFSHDTTFGNSNSSSSAVDQKTAENERIFTQWRLQVPRDDNEIRKARPLGRHLAIFLQKAREIVELDAGTMQGVIRALASEGGLFRIRELLENTNLESATDDELRSLVQNELFPLVDTITQDPVMRSFTVEADRATIFNFMYGINGSKAVRAFTALVRFLSLSEDDSASRIGPCIVALSGVYESNTSAPANDALRGVAETLIALAPDHAMTGSARSHCQRLRLRLGLASGIQNGSNVGRQAALYPGHFAVADNEPGELSSNGKRHDNDSEHIADIQILPTLEEISSDRPEYLPGDNPSEWHLGPGMAGLIDRQFRLVREDTIGQIRDAAHFQLQRLKGVIPDARHLQARTYIYDNVRLIDTLFTQSKGLHFVVGFPQIKEAGFTSQMREGWWEDTKRLAPDALVCLLGSDGLAIFLTVVGASPPPFPGTKAAEAQMSEVNPHERYPRSGNANTAYAVLQLVNHTPADLDSMFLRFGISKEKLPGHSFSLTEFSGVILPTFDPTLRALQHMSRLEIPFQDLLAPSPTLGQQCLDVPIPAYARAPGFKFDVSVLSTTEESLRVAPLDALSTDLLAEKTPLDYGQAHALSSALSRSLALVQGPPGTGKSYIGVALMKVLLANKRAAKLGPVVLVTFTNHALDQSLEHLVDTGIGQIVRIGSRSKSERLASCNLRALAQAQPPTKQEKYHRWKAHSAIETSAVGVASALRKIQQATNDAGIMAYLNDNHPEYHAQLSGPVEDAEGFMEWRPKRTSTDLRAWLKGSPASQRFRQVNGLMDDLFALSQAERHVLYAEWRMQASQRARVDLMLDLRAYEDAKTSSDNGRSEVDMNVLSNANVIGVTTSGLARNLKLLRKLNSKVLVVEEAGEVLEAHLLTAMLPSIEHAILIGDHQQLRPKAQNYELSCENPRSHMNFDLSLFERLVQPAQGRPSIPYISLEVQRRMHPSISRLIRSTLYPRLQDAPNVAEYPEVAGMRRRLFWLDHEQKEDNKQPGFDKTSHTNKYEVQMVFALVRHLVRQGVYKPSDIAVLTPYLGQLRSLRQALGSFAEIILSDRDTDELAQEDAGQSSNPAATNVQVTQPPTTVVKSTLLQALRLATIDNFQGEESKVVIISLVRSNDQRKCGFLKTSNRINVMLSRARHGMYIIGNSQTAEPVQMWHDVLNILREDDDVGRQLELCCPRHPETALKITKPEDFATVSPEAGCNLMCGRQLSCGHSCESKCHSEGMHNAVHCMKECTRLKPGCDHLCQYECGCKCDKKCKVLVTNIDVKLSCGHRVKELPCWLYQDHSAYECCEIVERSVPDCGHKVFVPCCTNFDDVDYKCSITCGSDLPCGHVCKKECKSCRPRNFGAVIKTDHGICQQRCGRDYTSCRHSCMETCHEGTCVPCPQPCEVGCSHSKCDRKCSEPCAPCAEDSCASTCPHSACNMPCAAPCDHVPCTLRCEKQLNCGHQCPSICGASCPDERFCQVCAPEEVQDQKADLIMFGAYRDVDLTESPCIVTPCGHVFTVESLDGHMSMGDHYEVDPNTGFPTALKGNSDPFSAKELKVCPNCRGPLRDLPRYGRIVRRALIDESTKKFIIWSNDAYLDLADHLRHAQEVLSDSREAFKLPATGGKINLGGASPLAALSSFTATQERYETLTNLRRAVYKFAKRVIKEEQPFSRVRELVEAARRRRASTGSATGEIATFDFDQAILQTRGRLLASALMIRTEIVAAADFSHVWSRMPAPRDLSVDFALSRENCEDLIAEAKGTLNPLQQVEGHVFWAHLAALECNVHETSPLPPATPTDVLKKAAEAHLAAAEEICQSHPGSTAKVAHEVDFTRQTLREGGFDSQMRMVVAAMATEFTGTGHWYTCANGHPFTIGECGMAMEAARCPQCDAPIGGSNHVAAAGVRHADDIERRFGGMGL